METTQEFTPTTLAVCNNPNQRVIQPESFNFKSFVIKDDNLLQISKPKVVVGRLASIKSNDFPVSKSKLISRQHFSIEYSNNEFTLLCMSKNGLYINERFYKKSTIAYNLPSSCRIRFPSTQIQLLFTNLIGSEPNIGTVWQQQRMLHDLVASHLMNNKTEGILGAITIINMVTNAQDHATANAAVSNEQLESGVETVRQESVAPPAIELAVPYSTPSERVDVKPEEPTVHTSGMQVRAPKFTMALNNRVKPPFSYAQLIIEAITSSPQQQLMLSEIYSFVQEKYPYYQNSVRSGWQNSIRHNLSLNRYFVKVPRTCARPGKGCYWRVDPNMYCEVITNRCRRWHKCFSSNGQLKDGKSCSAPATPRGEHSESCSAPAMDDQLATFATGDGNSTKRDVLEYDKNDV